MIALDEEGGDVTRLHYRSGSPDPGNYALGVADDLAITSEVAEGIGIRLRAAGVGFALAPVADVNADPRNPVIGVRSFGRDPQLVSRHTAAWITAVQARGVAACAKHFPGHGDTHTDSHIGLPVVGCDEREWRRTHLPPFVAAIEAGVRAVMTAHLVVPALDDQPATTSERLLGDLLRGELGFDGVIVTDALDMGAVTRSMGSEAAAVRALRAGADLLCLGNLDARGRYERVRMAIIEAVRCGDLPRSRVEQAATRVERLREWAAEHQRDAGLAAARAAVVVRDVRPVGAGAVVVQLRSIPNSAVGEAAWDFAGPLTRCGCPPAAVVEVGETDGDEVLAEVLERARHAPLIIVGRDVGRSVWQQAAVASLRAARSGRARGDTVLVDLGLPLVSWGADRGDGSDGPTVGVGGAARPNLLAAAEIVAGVAI